MKPKEGLRVSTMPFGKHRGETIDSLPDSYLIWLNTEATITAKWLREEVEREVNVRLGDGRIKQHEILGDDPGDYDENQMVDRYDR